MFFFFFVFFCLLTVWNIFQNFGEVDPFFVAAFFEELGTEWKIYDTNCILHNVEFNSSPSTPLLTSGWDVLKNYFGWTQTKILSFFFFGENKFFMLISNDSTSVMPSSYPSFHSLSTLVDNNRKFYMRVRSADLQSPHVVSLYLPILLLLPFFVLRFLTSSICQINIFYIFCVVYFFFSVPSSRFRTFPFWTTLLSIHIEWTFRQCFNHPSNN
jgi:hypothetical protein